VEAVVAVAVRGVVGRGAEAGKERIKSRLRLQLAVFRPRTYREVQLRVAGIAHDGGERSTDIILTERGQG
jgi:hypothetical protein